MSFYRETYEYLFTVMLIDNVDTYTANIGWFHASITAVPLLSLAISCLLL